MQLAIPLLIMLAVLVSAWGLGTLARGFGDTARLALAAAGIALLFVLPLAYETTIFDGNCYADDGTPSPCALSERLWQSFSRGFAFMMPPAIFWAAMFVLASRVSR